MTVNGYKGIFLAQGGGVKMSGIRDSGNGYLTVNTKIQSCTLRKKFKFTF